MDPLPVLLSDPEPFFPVVEKPDEDLRQFLPVPAQARAGAENLLEAPTRYPATGIPMLMAKEETWPKLSFQTGATKTGNSR